MSKNILFNSAGLSKLIDASRFPMLLCILLLSLPSYASTYQQNTPDNDDGGGNIVFLDRHHLNCGTDGMNSLRLYRPSVTQIAYEYHCLPMNYAGTNDLYTPANDDGGGNSIYLDRHGVDCSGTALQYLHLERPSGNTIRYHYKCSDIALSSVDDYYTPANADGGGNSIFLDRHHVSCPANEVLSYLRLQRPTVNTIRYHYKCGVYTDLAINGFTGDFAPGNWNISGVAASSMNASALTSFVSSGGGGVTATMTIPQDGFIYFDWLMTIYSPGQYGDVIRYVLNGVDYDLSTSGSASGSVSGIEVSAGDSFSFYTWGTTQSSSYFGKFENFVFVPNIVPLPPQCAFYGDNQGRNDPGFSGQTFVYQNSSYGTNRFMWDGTNIGEVPIGTNSVTDADGNVYTLSTQVSHPYWDVWYYEICVNM